MSDGWTVAVLAGGAGELHARPLGPERPSERETGPERPSERETGPEVVRRLDVLQVSAPALVLGSTQPAATVDLGAVMARGVELARRRSGGGAVLLEPGHTIWVDVEIPRSDVLWDDDVGRAFHWLGHVWADVLADLGVTASVHTGAIVETPWSRTVCFAGVGSGEVTIAGRKLVGISQRRTRAGARFQCVLHRRWVPASLVDLLALEDDERGVLLASLEDAGTALDVQQDELVEVVTRHLPG